MQIQNNVSLADFSTMRLGGIAKALVTATSRQELLDALAWAEQKSLPTLILGGGSNVIFSDGYDGLVIVNRITGLEILEDATGATLHIGAGENWDEVVARSVALGLHGIEFLSAIPGTAGATPVQNVGAYGAEIADTFVELEAYDLQQHSFVTLEKADCQFTYRDSIFKSPQKRRYIIFQITLRLNRELPKPPFYGALQDYLDAQQITNYTPQTIRDAVIAVRAQKLPDPKIVANTGSFFKNPIIAAESATQLVAKYPQLPHWPTPDGRVKLAAGWLIEQAGLKGYAAHGMKTHSKNALVVINEHAKDFNDLAAFKEEIVKKVYDKFGVTLEQEPELL